MADINQAVDAINTVQGVRTQLNTLRDLIKDDSTNKDIRGAADSLDKKFTAQEEYLRQLRATGRGQDLIRWPMRITEQLVYLGGSLDGADQPPTKQQTEVSTILHNELRAVKARIDVLM